MRRGFGHGPAQSLRRSSRPAASSSPSCAGTKGAGAAVAWRPAWWPGHAPSPSPSLLPPPALSRRCPRPSAPPAMAARLRGWRRPLLGTTAAAPSPAPPRRGGLRRWAHEVEPDGIGELWWPRAPARFKVGRPAHMPAWFHVDVAASPAP
jgi:hypothetical protein